MRLELILRAVDVPEPLQRIRFLAVRWLMGEETSFWDYQAGRWHRDEGLRIDHLLLSPHAADRIAACGHRQEAAGQRPHADLVRAGGLGLQADKAVKACIVVGGHHSFNLPHASR
jgi:hypothetical protein